MSRFKAMLESIVYIVIGNTSKQLETKKSPFTKTKKKYNWQLFAKVDTEVQVLIGVI